MSACRYCGGRGVTPPAAELKQPASRGAALGPLPPFGHEVEAASLAGACSPYGVSLFCGIDQWELAERSRERLGAGSAMILPQGHSVAAYRWPRISCRLVVWAQGLRPDQARALGAALLSVGYLEICVLGTDGCPMQFEADQVVRG